MEERNILKKCSISCFADEIAPDLETQLALLEELGIGWVEFRSADGKNVADYTIEEAEVLRRRLDRSGIRVSALGSPVGKIGILEDFAPHLEKLKTLTGLAKTLGTSCIRVFSFYLPDTKASGDAANMRPEDYREEVLRRTQAMVDVAAAEGVVLLHENEKGIYGDTAERCLDLMRNFYGEHYKCTFDFANFVQCGQDTLDAYEMLRPYISYVHVKDARRDTGTVTPAGEGDGQVADILRRLDGQGYEGVLSLEPHLADFSGLKNLEREAQSRGRTDGAEAFRLAYRALTGLLRQQSV
ncbi:MAG: sugar phosphate isomerase/epimerase [Lachnospiraceae bacterium]|nr:sugar phosphate isomerase/epimerase [Lachnospiraceae bacterium]